MSELPSLPQSSDKEFWQGEIQLSTPSVGSKVCATHRKDNYLEHTGYIENPDRSVSCKYCSWGTRIPGYMRVIDEKIVDLRDLNKQ